MSFLHDECALVLHDECTLMHAERTAWRSDTYLKLIRSIRRILEALTPPLDGTGFDGTDVDPYGYANGQGSSFTITERSRVIFSRYAQRLAPLSLLEQKLVGQLSDPDEDEPARTDVSRPLKFALECGETDSLGSYLNDIERITARRYIATDGT